MATTYKYIMYNHNSYNNNYYYHFNYIIDDNMYVRLSQIFKTSLCTITNVSYSIFIEKKNKTFVSKFDN